MAERARAGGAPEQQAVDANRLLRQLTFFIGNEEYGLPLSRVEEIASLDEVTRVATAPEFVLGLLSHEGAAIPVIDVARKFGAQHPASGQRRSVVIVEARIEGQAALVGLAVDRLGYLARVAASAIQPPPALDGLAGIEFLTGVFASEGRFVLCVDVDHLLGTEEVEQVSDLLHGGRVAERPAAEVPRLSFLTVHMAGEPCVLKLTTLLEIIRPKRISRVPGVAPFVLGATNVRGTVVPVLDLARRCGLAAAAQEPASWLVLVDAASVQAETPVGLAVDAIDGLEHVPFDRIDRTPPFGTRFPHAWVEGMVPMAGTFAPILDVSAALSPAGDSSVLDPQ